MFTFELDHIVKEEGETPVAYVKIKNNVSGAVVKVVNVNFTSRETFIAAMKLKVRALKTASGAKILVENEIRDILTTEETNINQ